MKVYAAIRILRNERPADAMLLYLAQTREGLLQKVAQDAEEFWTENDRQGPRPNLSDERRAVEYFDSLGEDLIFEERTL